MLIKKGASLELEEVERLPVSVAELNIKPYKCLRCGFRSDRKSDTLRHIKVKHNFQQPFSLLKILSIREASSSIELYERTKASKRMMRNAAANTIENISGTSPQNDIRSSEVNSKVEQLPVKSISSSSCNESDDRSVKK